MTTAFGVMGRFADCGSESAPGSPVATTIGHGSLEGKGAYPVKALKFLFFRLLSCRLTTPSTIAVGGRWGSTRVGVERGALVWLGYCSGGFCLIH
ncbi:unnamed protein product [Cuscuta europaea]|uniref:Uncharacterized protein n=1 Tax=Cuscuta europaea TaxID=41803 RepID=A0A9P0ZN77_CUSEU|nr:unnamed protein product [Cuscuta europaea]